MKTILSGLIVHEEKIGQNVDTASTLISTEALMFHLGKTLGKQTAHGIIYEASMEAVETRRPLIDLLIHHPEISGKFKREELQKIVDPAHHIGLSKELTRRVIDHVKGCLDATGAGIAGG